MNWLTFYCQVFVNRISSKSRLVTLREVIVRILLSKGSLSSLRISNKSNFDLCDLFMGRNVKFLWFFQHLNIITNWLRYTEKYHLKIVFFTHIFPILNKMMNNFFFFIRPLLYLKCTNNAMLSAIIPAFLNRPFFLLPKKQKIPKREMILG